MCSPRDGIVADIMRRTRSQYHYTVRELKNNINRKRKQSMASAISENNSRQLWSEVRKIRNKTTSIPN